LAFSSTPADSNNIPIGCVYVPGVGFKALQGGTLFTDASSNDSAPVRVEEAGGSKATYSASILGLAPITTAPTDIFTLTGSATKLIKVTRVTISGSTTLATQAVIPIAFVKRSTADTAGTSTAPTIVPHDSNNAAGTATVLAYTVPPTTGTLVGVIRNFRTTLLLTPQTATDFPVGMPYIEDFGMRPAQPPTLRGVAQVFAINLNGIAVVAGWLFDISVEWTEE